MAAAIAADTDGMLACDAGPLGGRTGAGTCPTPGSTPPGPGSELAEIRTTLTLAGDRCRPWSRLRRSRATRFEPAPRRAREERPESRRPRARGQEFAGWTEADGLRNHATFSNSSWRHSGPATSSEIAVASDTPQPGRTATGRVRSHCQPMRRSGQAATPRQAPTTRVGVWRRVSEPEHTRSKCREHGERPSHSGQTCADRLRQKRNSQQQPRQSRQQADTEGEPDDDPDRRDDEAHQVRSERGDGHRGEHEEELVDES